MKNSSKSDPAVLHGEPTKTRKIGTAANRRHWIVLTRAIWVALGVHAMFIALFHAIGATFLAVVNVGSVLIYAVCIGLLRRRRNKPVIFLAWVEVIGHAALAVRSLGWDSGFHYYLLIFIPLIFVSTTRRPGSTVALAGLLGLIYGGMSSWAPFRPSMSSIP